MNGAAELASTVCQRRAAGRLGAGRRQGTAQASRVGEESYFAFKKSYGGCDESRLQDSRTHTAACLEQLLPAHSYVLRVRAQAQAVAAARVPCTCAGSVYYMAQSRGQGMPLRRSGLGPVMHTEQQCIARLAQQGLLKLEAAALRQQPSVLNTLLWPTGLHSKAEVPEPTCSNMLCRQVRKNATCWHNPACPTQRWLCMMRSAVNTAVGQD